MTTLWKLLISWLVWLSADQAAIDAEPAKAAAAVAVARGSMQNTPAPDPQPSPVPSCKCGGTCVRGIWKPDGHIQAKCDCACKRCVAERAR